MYTPTIIDRQTGQRLHAATWIDVQAELPDDSVSVLVYDPAADDPVWVGYVDGDVWRSAEGEIIAPTYWMPFPDPPTVPVAR